MGLPEQVDPPGHPVQVDLQVLRDLVGPLVPVDLQDLQGRVDLLENPELLDLVDLRELLDLAELRELQELTTEESKLQ